MIAAVGILSGVSLFLLAMLATFIATDKTADLQSLIDGLKGEAVTNKRRIKFLEDKLARIKDEC